jgi:hypothetical protein
MAVVLNASTSAGAVLSSDTSGVLQLSNNGTVAVTVTGGNVGIGTISPLGKLDVASKFVVDTTNTYGKTSYARYTDSSLGSIIQGTDVSGTANGLYLYYTGGNAQGMAFDGSNIVFYNNTNTTERMRITSAGNVGIGGTPLSDARLLISNGGAVGMEFSPNIAIANENRLLSYNRGTSVYAPMNYDASVQKFLTGGIEAMRIDSSGNLMLGTTTANGKATINGIFTVQNTNTYNNSIVNTNNSVTTGTLTTVSSVTIPNSPSGQARILFTVTAENLDSNAGYSVACSVREVLVTNYGGLTNIIKSTELSNNQGSINSGVINVTLATSASVSGTKVLLQATPSASGSVGSTNISLGVKVEIISSNFYLTVTTP